MTVKLNVRLPDVQIVQMDVLYLYGIVRGSPQKESVRCGGHVWQTFLTLNLVIFKGSPIWLGINGSDRKHSFPLY